MASDEGYLSVATILDDVPQIEIDDLAGHLVDTRMCGDDALTCRICSKKYCDPRLLTCLHGFCQECLNIQLSSNSTSDNVIICPECHQETKVDSGGAASLPRDFVTLNILKTFEIQSANLVCSSCNSGMMAVASCHDCAEYLCAVCFNAHQSMRCFNSHQVSQFSGDINGSVETKKAVCKHVLCIVHPEEKLTFYCNNCEVLICNECVSTQHQAHRLWTRFDDVVSLHKGGLEELVQAVQAKSAELNEVSASVYTALGELQQRHNEAKEALIEKYNEFRSNLKTCKERGLQKLEELQTQEESKLAAIREATDNTKKKIEGACSFTSQLMELGNTVEMLSLKNIVRSQLRSIISFSKPNVCLNAEFESTLSAFENAVKPAATRRPPDEDYLLDSWSSITSTSDLNTPVADLNTPGHGPASVSFSTGFSRRRDSETHRGPHSADKTTSHKARSGPTEMVKKIGIKVHRRVGGPGFTEGRFSMPRDFCLGWKDEIVVADTENNRVQVFDRNGGFKFQFGEKGRKDGQLYRPMKIAAFQDSGKIVVGDCSDTDSSRLQLYTKHGAFIRKINGGSTIGRLGGLTVTERNDIVTVDRHLQNIVVLKESGELLHKFSYAKHVHSPFDIQFWGNEYYVCDLKGGTVVVLGEDGSLKRRFKRTKYSAFYHPSGIEVIQSGKVFVSNSHNQLCPIIEFNADGKEHAHYCCTKLEEPLRLCGLKLNKEGFLITVLRDQGCFLILKKN